MTRRSRGGSSRRAASSSTGSASAATWAGRSWVPWASTWAWAIDSSPSARAWPVAVSGPRYSARAVRTQPAAVLALMRSRVRSQLAVEPAWTPCSAPAAPRASTAASSASQWPSRRSMSPRNTMTRSAPAPSASRSGSWSARPWSSATSACNAARVPAGWLVEWVFESMAATYQPRTQDKHQPENVENPAVTDFTRPSIEGSTAASGQPQALRLVGNVPTRPSARTQVVAAYPPGRGQPPCQATAWGPDTPDHPASSPHGTPTTPGTRPTLPPNHTGPDGPGKAHPTPTPASNSPQPGT